MEKIFGEPVHNGKKKKKKGCLDSSLDFTKLPYIRGRVKRRNATAWVLFDGERAGVYPKRKMLKKILDENPELHWKAFNDIISAIEAFKNPEEHLKPRPKATPLF